MNEWGAQDLQRRLANLIRIATITELDDAGARARVTCASVPDSAWLPILTQRAGPDRSYWLPEPGEQVMILSPSGDSAQGMILPAGFQDAYPPPANVRTTHRHEYADGTVTEYDRASHTLTVDCVGDIVVRAAGALTAEITGNVQAAVQGTASATVQGAVSLTTPTGITINAPLTTVNGALTGTTGQPV
jgi:phage baseplate assembly protein V